jgi:hypothetical protein
LLGRSEARLTDELRACRESGSIGTDYMSRECGCLGGNANCTRCYGLGSLEGDDYLTLSSEPGSLGSADPDPPQKPPTSTLPEPNFRWRDSQAPKPDANEDLHIPAFGCPYCAARFNSDERREAHVNAGHVESEDYAADGAEAKPLVRLGGRVFDRSELRQVERRAIKTKLHSEHLATEGLSAASP